MSNFATYRAQRLDIEAAVNALARIKWGIEFSEKDGDEKY